MISALETVTGPAIEPVTVERAATHLRIDAEAPGLRAYIQAATGWAETFLARALISQKLLWTIASSPPSGGWPMVGFSTTLLVLPQWLAPNNLGVRPLTLPRHPVLSVDSITQGQWGQSSVTLDPTAYSVSLGLGQVHLAGSIGLGASGRLGIGFTAGYGSTADAVPMPIRQAILMLTAWFYEHRGDDDATEPPMAVKALLTPYRQVTFG